MIRLRCLLPVLCLGGLLAGALPGAAPAADPDAELPADNSRIRWESPRDAQARSRAEQKPLLLHFTAAWSGSCRQMQRETYRDPRVVAYLNEHFAMATVDTDDLPALARKYGVKGLPTLWFLDPTGRRLTHLDGFAGADTLLPLLEFVVTKAYTWTDYTTWRERRR